MGKGLSCRGLRGARVLRELGRWRLRQVSTKATARRFHCRVLESRLTALELRDRAEADSPRLLTFFGARRAVAAKASEGVLQLLILCALERDGERD